MWKGLKEVLTAEKTQAQKEPEAPARCDLQPPASWDAQVYSLSMVGHSCRASMTSLPIVPTELWEMVADNLHGDDKVHPVPVPSQ